MDAKFNTTLYGGQTGRIDAPTPELLEEKIEEVNEEAIKRKNFWDDERAREENERQLYVEKNKDSKQALYKKLVEQGLYTKSFSDFNEQFDNEQSRLNLFKALSSADYYTKDYDSFQNQFFDNDVSYYDDYSDDGSYSNLTVDADETKSWMGWFDGVTAGYKTGTLTADAISDIRKVMVGGKDATKEEIEEYIRVSNAINESAQMQKGLQTWMKAFDYYRSKGFDYASATLFASRKAGWGGLAGVTVQSFRSLANLETASVATTVGVGTGFAAAAAGNLAGVTAVLPEEILTGPGGFMFGAMTAGNTYNEVLLTFNNMIQEELDEQNLPFTYENVRHLLQDPQFVSEARTTAASRGAFIGTTEAVLQMIGVGVASKAVTKTAKKVKDASKFVRGTTQATTAGVTSAPFEVVGGMVGETGGLLIEGKELDAKEIILEGIAGLATAPVTGGIALLGKARPGTYKINGKSVSGSYIQEIMKTATDDQIAAMNIEIKNDKQLQGYVDDKIGNVRDKATLNARVTRKKDIDAILELKKRRRKFTGDSEFDKAQRADIDDQIKAIESPYIKRGRMTKAQKQTQAFRDKVLEALKQRNIAKTMSFLDSTGMDYNSLSQQETDDFINSLPESENKKKFKSMSDRIGGFVYDGKIYINREGASKTNQVNVGAHEFLHAVLNAKVKNQKQLYYDIQDLLTDNQINKIKADIKSRYGVNANEDTYAKEFLTVFSDLLNPDSKSPNKLKFNDSFYQKLKGSIINILRRFGFYQIDFDSAQGVYEFMRDYSKSVRQGQLTDDLKNIIGDIDEGTGTGIDASLSPIQSEIVNQTFEEGGLTDYNQFQILETLRDTAKNIANRYNDRPSAPNSDRTLRQDQAQKDLLVDEILTGERGMLDVIRSYPGYVKKQLDAGKTPAPLSGYINKSFSTETGFKRYIDIADRILGKGEESVFGTSLDNEQTTTQIADEVVETKKPVVRGKIDPREMLSDENAQAYNDAVDISNIDNENISFKKLKGQASEITANEVGIPVSKLKPANNFSKTDLINSAKFIFNNISQIRKLMPKGAVLEAATEALIGTSTGIQKSLLDAFYTKQDRITKGAGIYPHTINKLTDSAMLKALGIDKDGNVVKGLSPRSTEAQRQKAIISLVDKLISNTIVREKLKEQGASPNVIQDIQAGTSDIQFSVANQDKADQYGQGDTYPGVSEQARKSIDQGITAADYYISGVKKIKTYFDELHPGLLNAGEFVNGLNLRGYDAVKYYLRSKLNDLGFKRGKYPKRDFAKYVGKTVEQIKKNKNKIAEYNKQAEINFDAFWTTINKILTDDPKMLGVVLQWLENSISSKTHPHRNGALFTYLDETIKGKVYFEHALQNANAYRVLIDSIMDPTQDFNSTLTALKKNYKLIGLSYADNKKLDQANLKNNMDLTGQWNVFDNNWWERYFNEAIFALGGISTKNLLNLETGKSFIQEKGINSQGFKITPELDLSISEVNENNKKLEAKQQGRLRNKPEKGISVFDFDDTLAQTNSQVIVTMPDGSTNKINATEFALQSADLEAAGAVFDFTEFNKVIEGKKGPLFELALRRQDKFTSKDIFVLTARPQEAAYAIHAFLKGIGLEIPMANITGLEDGRPQAKADWIIGKAAEGYNNFYFADDAYKNVKAVQDVLNQIDVKGKVQQAKIQMSLSEDFNAILEDTKGIGREKRFSNAAAKSRGKAADKFQFFLPPSAEDFVGLIYSFLDKGKRGEEQLKFFEKTLIKPFARAIQEINSAKQAYASNYRKLQKHYPEVKKILQRKTEYNDFTYDAAIRVYIWNKLGYKIPGISKTDQKRLSDIVANDSDLKSYAEILNSITNRKNFPEPNENWVIGTIVSDINDITQRVGRKKYLSEWVENKNEIFSPENLNKIEAAYGTGFREALEDMLYRMENGTNRQSGNNKLTNSFLNWVNNSVGAIMFFNFRSATLQTISLFNFINWSDNNPLKFASAVLNTKQYAKDFAMIFNSDMLRQRRRGLQTDVNEAEIARAMNTSNNKPAAILRYLLQKGFIPTQMADSFAIASGGATFYRNRVNTYLKQGLSQAEAEQKAFMDFAEASEKAQQSARPDMISMQQASPLGRLILAFQNTPMQYMRLTKKAFLDLKNGRGDWKTNTSKLVYYVAIQNLIFSTLSNAMFGMLFDDEEEEMWDKKKGRVINNMMDTVLRGSGVYGAVASTIKNMIMRFQYEANKGRNPDYTYVMIEGLNLSPPVGSKARKLYNALQSYKFDSDEMKAAGFSLDNPGLLAVGNVLSATANIPLDRAVMILNNIKEASDSENEAWQRIAMLLGWNTWDVGVDPYGDIEIPKKSKKKKKTTIKIKENK